MSGILILMRQESESEQAEDQGNISAGAKVSKSLKETEKGKYIFSIPRSSCC
jgi:hypothetical protein